MSVAANRKAWHEYRIEQSFEAGIELRGSEVKSLRQRQVNFADAYARIENGECWLIGLHLSPYEKAHVQLPDPLRRRRLLLKRREIEKLHALTERSGYTLIPLEVYFLGRWAKLKLGVARGKSAGDKRQALRDKLTRREIDRALKSARRR